MTKLLDEFDEKIDWRPDDGRYWVELRDSDDNIVKDHLSEYRHAPKLNLKAKNGH